MVKNRSKKGSLNLSINAIVVLILAVTLLSLGLTFIQKTFGGATQKLDDQLGGIDEQHKQQLMAQCFNDACLESTSLTLSRNQEKNNLIVVNNKLDCDTAVNFKVMYDQCTVINSDDTPNCESDIVLETYEKRTVPHKSKITIPLNVKVKNSAKPTTYGYPIVVNGACGDSQLHQELWLDVDIG